MDMGLREEQQELRDLARRVMAAECSPDAVREIESGELGYSRDMWRRMAELGWLALPLPEAYGGFGLGIVDLVILAKELGRALCPSPYIPTVVLAAGAITAAGTQAQKDEHLPRIAAGESIFAFALQEEEGGYDYRGVAATGTRTDGGWVLDGIKLFVEFAGIADRLVVVARTGGSLGSPDGLTMFVVDPGSDGLEMTHLPTMARDRQYLVALHGVAVRDADVLGTPGEAWPVLERVIQGAATTFSGYLVGASERMHELSTAYAKERVQFGRPIGSFQVIQGYLAQLIMEIWGAETLTYCAAWTIDEGRPPREIVAKAKSFAGDTFRRTSDIGSQIFGGIGYMEGVDSTLYLRRGKQYQLTFGDTAFWERIAAEELLDR